MTDYQKIAYLDHAATTPMPDEVLAVVDNYYQMRKVNVHRGMYQLAHQVTVDYENVRKKVAQWLHAKNSSEVVFTSGTTEALNLVAFGFAKHQLEAGDEILTTVVEHHSNLVPWQQVANQTGAKLKVVGLNHHQAVDVDKLIQQINTKTKIVTISLMSNVLGQRIDVAKIAEVAHKYQAVVVVDAAQAMAHLPVNVADLGADFLAFSGHKMYGPTGIGVLYGRQKYLEQVTPQRFGGEMIDLVTEQQATFQALPLRLEAGTPNIAGVLGLGAAIDFINQQGYQQINQQEQKLSHQVINGLKSFPQVDIYGNSPTNSDPDPKVISFNFKGIHAHDVATILDTHQVAVRAGHMCAQPLMQALGVESVVRVSLSFLNSADDIRQLLTGLQQVEELLG